MQYLEAVIDTTRVSDIYQGFGVADFHQCRRMNVLVFFQHRDSLPQPFSFFSIIKLTWVIGLPQVNLHLHQIIPLPHGVHAERVTEAAWLEPSTSCTLRLYWERYGEGMVFTDGLSSQDYFPALCVRVYVCWWEEVVWDKNTLVSISGYTDTEWWEFKHVMSKWAKPNMRTHWTSYSVYSKVVHTAKAKQLLKVLKLKRFILTTDFSVSKNGL